MEPTPRRTAIVTGGSRGIGRAIVRELAGAGLSVHFTWNTRQEAARRVEAEAAREAGMAREAGAACEGGPARAGRVVAHRLDVRDERACETLVDEVVRAEGAVDVLVNNAGALRDGLFALQSAEDWHAVLETNLDGMRHCCRAAIRPMLARRAGTIINMTSVAGVLGPQGQTSYAAAKGAIVAFTKALAREVAEHGILVHAVAPGLIETDMLAQLPAARKERALARVPLGRVGRPEEVAALVAFLVLGRCTYSTGHVFFVDGGLAM